VKFNATNASFSVVADTQISALVPAIATTGPISVTTSAGTTLTSSNFVVAPRISTFAPASGVAGTSVTIQGANFTDLLAVRFGDVPASFTNVSASQINAIVPDEALTASINVTTPGGIVASTNLFLVLPGVRSFAPSSGTAGTSVTINGTGFSGATGVSFGGISAASFNVLSATQIVAVVPASAQTGPITVSTPSGSGRSSSSFFVGAAADLSLAQSVSADPVVQSQVLVYTVVLTNQGPSSATAIVLSNQLPSDVFLSSATINVGTVKATGTGLRAEIPSLAGGAVAQMLVTVLPLEAGTLTNMLVVSAKEGDLDLTNNTSVRLTTVLTNSAVLRLDEVNDSQLQISWPASATNLVLQTADGLSVPGLWQNVTTPPILSGGRKSLLITVGSGSRFYRLRSP
jgi:uncharacterized repeat protein (TIGR01451 family)